MRLDFKCPSWIHTDNNFGRGSYLVIDGLNNCPEGGLNEAYSGNIYSDIRIDSHNLFSFHGLESKIIGEDPATTNYMPFKVESSKGGLFSTGEFPTSGGRTGIYDFSGSLWTDVRWIELSALDPGVNFHARAG